MLSNFFLGIKPLNKTQAPEDSTKTKVIASTVKKSNVKNDLELQIKSLEEKIFKAKLEKNEFEAKSLKSELRKLRKRRNMQNARKKETEDQIAIRRQK